MGAGTQNPWYVNFYISHYTRFKATLILSEQLPAEASLQLCLQE